MIPSGDYPRFRAPPGDGEILCVPAPAELPGLVARGRQRPELAQVEWSGRSLAELSQNARQEILDEATAYTRQYADVGVTTSAERPLVVTGHQPELFHPGVWLKNFEADRLAKQVGGMAIDLIIDSDLWRASAIRVPMGSPAELQTELVRYDQALIDLPFEERGIADLELWQSFGSRVAHKMAGLVDQPLIKEWWPSVLAASRKQEKIGYALAEARHQLEIAWGSRSLELPQSRVCQSEAFRWFASELLNRAIEFRTAYNGALADYRVAHQLKNKAQPVPDLAEHDGWVETPFWLWTTSDPTRRGVYVRRVENQLEITDRNQLSAVLSTNPSLAVEQFAELERHGVKFRTRALATTLFARLLLADVFIHGIGGAKYDQVTDAIGEKFFGVELPHYATISGTLRLPIAASDVAVHSPRELRQELRSQQYHPERFLDEMIIPLAEVSRVHALLAKKQQWINTPKSMENAAERHQAITAANAVLQQYLSKRAERLEQNIVDAKHAASIEQLRRSREYAFCLFPPALLQQFLRTEKS